MRNILQCTMVKDQNVGLQRCKVGKSIFMGLSLHVLVVIEILVLSKDINWILMIWCFVCIAQK